MTRLDEIRARWAAQRFFCMHCGRFVPSDPCPECDYSTSELSSDIPWLLEQLEAKRDHCKAKYDCALCDESLRSENERLRDEVAYLDGQLSQARDELAGQKPLRWEVVSKYDCDLCDESLRSENEGLKAKLAKCVPLRWEVVRDGDVVARTITKRYAEAIGRNPIPGMCEVRDRDALEEVQGE